MYLIKELEEMSLKFPNIRNDKCYDNYLDFIITYCIHISNYHSTHQKMYNHCMSIKPKLKHNNQKLVGIQ
jgi:hypothetical protein